MRREDALQKAVAKMLDYSGLVWQHSPNEGQRTARQGKHAKDMGLKSGFPDIAIYDKGANGEPLAIELKAPNAKGYLPKPGAIQLAWHDKLRRCGWRVEVCWTFDEVLALLKEHYPSTFGR
jgi:hypothetical protein